MKRHKLYASLIAVICLSASAMSLTLKESISIALKNNPEVVSSQKKLDAANARLAQAIGAFTPTVKLSGNVGREYSQPYAVQVYAPPIIPTPVPFSFGIDSATDSRGYSASLTQPLLVAALLPGFNIAKLAADTAKEDLSKTMQGTAYDTTVAYFALLKADEFVKLSNESLDMAKSHLSQVQAMISAGVATRSDLLRAEVQVANSEVALTKANNGFELAKGSLNNVMGQPIDAQISFSDQEHTSTQATAPGLSDLTDTAFKYLPDWKMFKMAGDIADQNVWVQRSAYVPTLMLSGSTGDQITYYPSYTTDVRNWSITGSASITLFDGLGIQNRIREAEANLDAQKASEENVRNGIILSVRNALLDFNAAEQTITSAKKAVDLAEENDKVSELRYKSGVATNIEVLDAQVALTQARSNYSQALFDLEIAKAKINKSVGQEVL
ncbi:MAG TPA: TolC family protein [Candidatus Omnitrophota bacterium]|nr:TolC family protein [Candidatus Omnitrophota bacterium]